MDFNDTFSLHEQKYKFRIFRMLISLANVSTHNGQYCHYSTHAERSFMKSWRSIREMRSNNLTSMLGRLSILYMLLLSQGIWRASHSTLRPCRSSSAATILPMCNPCICSFSDIKKFRELLFKWRFW